MCRKAMDTHYCFIIQSCKGSCTTAALQTLQFFDEALQCTQTTGRLDSDGDASIK